MVTDNYKNKFYGNISHFKKPARYRQHMLYDTTLPQVNRKKNNESAYCLKIYIQVNFFLTGVMAHNFLKSEGKGK